MRPAVAHAAKLRCGAAPPRLALRVVDTGESRFVDRRLPAARFGGPRPAASDWDALAPSDPAGRARWERGFQAECARIVASLQRQCGLEFRGRILEVGAGAAWLSAELSKLPQVVEVVTTDFSTGTLREEVPRVLRLLGARAGKITRIPADFHRLDFPDRSFDFVVCANALWESLNLPQVLRECRRVLKPGGCFVAVREPVRPLLHFAARPGAGPRREARRQLLTARQYAALLAAAGFAARVRRFNPARGWKYYFDALVNGLTHARYVFVARRLPRG